MEGQSFEKAHHKTLNDISTSLYNRWTVFNKLFCKIVNKVKLDIMILFINRVYKLKLQSCSFNFGQYRRVVSINKTRRGNIKNDDRLVASTVANVLLV